MKKMMIIAALIGGMLIPAQSMANNDKGNAKPKVENRGKEKRGYKIGKKDNRKPDYRPGKPGKPGRPDYRPDYRPNRPVVVVNRPAPRPCPPPPPPPPVRRCYYDNPAADAAVTVLGIAALISLIAD